MTKEEKGLVVKTLQNGDGKKRAKTGPPRKIVRGSQMARFGNYGGGGGGSFGANVSMASSGNFYSYDLSTDFLELPQSLHEKWAAFRHFYRNEPFVAQAIDLRTELPLSKVRIGIPKARNREIAEAATNFCTKWAKKIRLLDRLLAIVHERNVIGEVFVWVEDENPEMPDDVRYDTQRILTEEGEAVEQQVERPDADERAAKWLKKNYKGWTAIRCLTPELVTMRSFSFTDERIIELSPDAETKKIVEQAAQGDVEAIRIRDSIPRAIVEASQNEGKVLLNTDPDAGGFCYYLANRKSDYDARGSSILERCIRVLVYRDKLRQAQTSIASRHMTPIRLVWGENLDETQVEELREQIDMALQDPDYSIIANYEVRWEEMGVDQRVPDLASEYELTDRQLYAGMGVTEGLLSGEGAYGGDRISLEVINTRFMLLREELQELVEEAFFRPMCRRMGFIEEDEDGEEVVVVPTLSFTRLALRDNRDTFDSLYNLYQKGSLDIGTILELFNLDPITVRENIERDLFTVNDPNFNEVLRGIYGELSAPLIEGSDVTEKVAKQLGLKFKAPAAEGEEDPGRF